jgi:hypothetical protein
VKRYTIDSADIWEYKTLVFPPDTTGTIVNDNNARLYITYWLGNGTNRTTGTNQLDRWNSIVTSSEASGQTGNIASSVGSYIQFTQIQYEIGKNATEFEHRSYGEELALCQRYFERIGGSRYSVIGTGKHRTTSESYFNVVFQVPKRSVPTVSWVGPIITTDRYTYDQNVSSLDQSEPSLYGFHGAFTHTAVGSEHNPIFILGPPNSPYGYMDFSSEL